MEANSDEVMWLGELLAVLSGKGGTGKTSVCAGVAVALAAAGKKVLCVDCDVGLRNLDISLGMSECGALSFLDVMEGGYGIEKAAHHPSFPQLQFLTAPLNRGVEQIDPEAFRRMLIQARGQFDFIFLDAPAGVDAGFRLVSGVADRFLLVTGAGPAAMRDAARVGDLLEIEGKKNVRLIVNRISRSMLSAVRLTVDDVMDNTGLPLLGIVMEDPNVTLAASFERPVELYAPRSDEDRAFSRIADRIQGYVRPIKLR